MAKNELHTSIEDSDFHRKIIELQQHMNFAIYMQFIWDNIIISMY